MWNCERHETTIRKEKYSVCRYCIPTTINPQISFLRKYFRVMDRIPIPRRHRNRRHFVEYAEAAIMLFARVEQFYRLRRPLIAGSTFLTPCAWVVFGEANAPARHRWPAFHDVALHYERMWFMPQIQHNNRFFHFRKYGRLADDLASHLKSTPHYIMTTALLLLHDVLRYCGPDTYEFSDLFTNDNRDTPNYVDLDIWEAVRCKVLGRHGAIKAKPYKYYLGQVTTPLLTVSKTSIEERDCDDDLSIGEITKPCHIPHQEQYEIEENMLAAPGDEVGSMYESGAAVQQRMMKYPHLF